VAQKLNLTRTVSLQQTCGFKCNVLTMNDNRALPRDQEDVPLHCRSTFFISTRKTQSDNGAELTACAVMKKRARHMDPVFWKKQSANVNAAPCAGGTAHALQLHNFSLASHVAWSYVTC
jgi:hypothetical protein